MVTTCRHATDNKIVCLCQRSKFNCCDSLHVMSESSHIDQLGPGSWILSHLSIKKAKNGLSSFFVLYKSLKLILCVCVCVSWLRSSRMSSWNSCREPLAFWRTCLKGSAWSWTNRQCEHAHAHTHTCTHTRAHVRTHAHMHTHINTVFVCSSVCSSVFHSVFLSVFHSVFLSVFLNVPQCVPQCSAVFLSVCLCALQDVGWL